MSIINLDGGRQPEMLALVVADKLGYFGGNRTRTLDVNVNVREPNDGDAAQKAAAEVRLGMCASDVFTDCQS